MTNATPIGNPIEPKDTALNGKTATANVKIDVQAPKRAEIDVASVDVTHDHGARRIRITIDNVGSSSAAVSGTLALGTPAVNTPIHADVPPRDQATVYTAWPKSLPTNRAQQATVTLHHGDDNAQWSGSLDPRPAPKHTTVTAAAAAARAPGSGPSSSGGGLGVPWWVLLAIIIAVVWLGYEVYAASRARSTGASLPLNALTALPLIDGAASARLHNELEPLVAAISALAESMQQQQQQPRASACRFARRRDVGVVGRSARRRHAAGWSSERARNGG